MTQHPKATAFGMQTNLLVCSDVFISLVREEMDHAFNLLFEDSEMCMTVSKERGFVLVLSYLFFDEVKKAIGLDEKSVLDFFERFCVMFCTVRVQRDHIEKAERIQRETGIHFLDALHVAIAKENACDYLISWNKKDFQKTEGILQCLTPKEFIYTFQDIF